MQYTCLRLKNKGVRNVSPCRYALHGFKGVINVCLIVIWLGFVQRVDFYIFVHLDLFCNTQEGINSQL